MRNGKVAALLMAAAMVTSLVGCGERAGIANDNDILGDESGYTSQNSGGLFGSNSGTGSGSGSGSQNSGSMGGSGKSSGANSGNGSGNMGGSSTNGGSGMQNGNGSMNGTTGGSNGTTGSGTAGGTSGMNGGTNGMNNQNRTSSGVSNYSTVNPANGMAMHTATWHQMVQNGCVHDRDGFLLDGENSSW